jgi:hypothetical protein
MFTIINFPNICTQYKVPEDMFKGAGKKPHVIPFKRLARENHNKVTSLP